MLVLRLIGLSGEVFRKLAKTSSCFSTKVFVAALRSLDLPPRYLFRTTTMTGRAAFLSGRFIACLSLIA